MRMQGNKRNETMAVDIIRVPPSLIHSKKKHYTINQNGMRSCFLSFLFLAQVIYFVFC